MISRKTGLDPRQRTNKQENAETVTFYRGERITIQKETSKRRYNGLIGYPDEFTENPTLTIFIQGNIDENDLIVIRDTHWIIVQDEKAPNPNGLTGYTAATIRKAPKWRLQKTLQA